MGRIHSRMLPVVRTSRPVISLRKRAFLILVDPAAGESSVSMLEPLFRLGVAELPTQTSFPS